MQQELFLNLCELLFLLFSSPISFFRLSFFSCIFANVLAPVSWHEMWAQFDSRQLCATCNWIEGDDVDVDVDVNVEN